MAPRKQVDALPGYGQAPNPASSPQGVIAFAPRTSPLLELAQSLGGIRREFDQMANKRLEEITAEETAAGRAAAMQDEFKSWRELVASGKVPPSEHPAFYTAYEQQKGRVAGQEYSAFINDKMASWDGRGTDNMSGGDLIKVLPEWRKEYFDKVGQTTTEFMTGVMAYAEQSENNLVSQHIAEARRNAEENMGHEIYNEFYKAMSDPSLSKEQLFAKFDEIGARQDFLGLRNKVGPLMLEALVNKAVDTGDVDLIDKVAEYNRIDSKTGQRIPLLKNTRALAVLEKARNDAARAAVNLDNLQRQQQDKREADVTRDSIKKVFDGDYANIDPMQFANEVGKNGGNPMDAYRAITTIKESNQGSLHRSAADRLNLALFDMMTNPDPKKSVTDYLLQVGPDAGPSGMKAVNDAYEDYVLSGKSLLLQHPGIAEVISANTEVSTGMAPTAEDRFKAQVLVTQALRRVLPDAKGKTPEQVRKEVENEINSIKKQKQEREAAAEEEIRKAAALAEQNTTARVSATPTGGQPSKAPQSSLALQPVASPAELAGLVGKKPEEVNAFLRSKPIMKPSEFALAQEQVLRGSRGPEALRLERMMRSLGFDTNNMRKAVMELRARGQGRFYPYQPKR